MNRIQTLFRRPSRAILAVALAAAALLSACKAKTDEEILRGVDMQLQQRNILSATLQLKDFLKKRPKSPNIQIARMKLAQCYFLDREFDKSRATLDDVIAASGGRGNQVGLNAVTLKLDTWVAETKFKEALDEALATSPTLRGMEPKYQNYFLMRTAELYINNNLTTDALKTFDAMLEQPNLEDEYGLHAVRTAGKLYIGTKQNDKAAAVYEGYLQKHPDASFNFVLHRDLGQLLAYAEKKDASKAHFDEAEKIIKARIEEALGAEKKSGLYFELADTYFAQDRKEDGKAAIRRVIDDFPTGKLRGQAMMMLAESYNQDGDVETALDQLGKVTQAFPGTQEAMIAGRRAQEIRAARAKGDAATSGTAKTADAMTTASAKTADTATSPAAQAHEAGKPGTAGEPGEAGHEGEPGKAGEAGAAGEAGSAAAEPGQAGAKGQDGASLPTTTDQQPAPAKAPAKKSKSKKN